MMKEILKEIQNTKISKGNSYTLSSDIGNFKKGDKIKVDKTIPSGEDIQLYLSNNQGVTDVLYIDKNDNFEELL